MKKQFKKPGYGTKCSECGKPLGIYQVTGRLGGKKVSFCSFRCQDVAMDKHIASS